MAKKKPVQKPAEPDVALLHDSFPDFLVQLWGDVGLGKPSRVQLAMALWLQNGPQRRGIKGFRGVAKTWITIAYILWRFHRNPNERVLLVSQSLQHARKSLHMARQWLEAVQWLNYLRPTPQSTQRDSADMFDVGPSRVDRQASLTAMGITGMITGNRASIIIPDDVETPENTMTIEQRVRLRDRVTEFEAVLLPGSESEIIYLGTPHHEDSLYDFLPDHGYLFRTWPCRYPAPTDRVNSLCPALADDLAKGLRKPGDPTWPERFDDEDLTRRALSMGKTRFAMQFMLISGIADNLRHPLKLADLIVYPVNNEQAPDNLQWGTSNSNGSTAIQDISPCGLGSDRFYAPIMVSQKWRPYVGTKAFLDPAGAGEDEMAWAIVSQLHGFLFVKHVNGVKGGATPANLDLIARSLREHGATELSIETNFGGDMLIQLMRPVLNRLTVSEATNPRPDEAPVKPWSCSVEGVHSTGQKEVRICNALEPVLNAHRMVVSPEVARDIYLMHQLTHITRERNSLEHDDRLDALAGAVSLWRDVLDQDSFQQSQRRNEEDFASTLAEYQARLFKKPAQPLTWMRY